MELCALAWPEFLSEELGDGDPRDAHSQLYDELLRSLGVKEKTLKLSSPSVIGSLEKIRKSLEQETWPHRVGLRGMDSECLCQIYLSSMYDNFIRNPYIRQRRHELAWKLWDIYTGQVDVEHRLRTRRESSGPRRRRLKFTRR